MFAFRLCLAIGELHPDYILDRLTSRQLAEWMAYFRLRPFGQDHSDYLIAQLTRELANRNRAKSERIYKTSDFLPLHRGYMSPEQVKQTLRGILRGSRRKS